MLTPERAVQDGKQQDNSIANYQLISSDVGDGKALQLHVQASTREETTNIEHVTKAREGNVSRGDLLSGSDELLRSNILNRRRRSLPCTMDRMEMRLELQAVPIELPVAGALQVYVHKDFRAVRAIDTTNSPST